MFSDYDDTNGYRNNAAIKCFDKTRRVVRIELIFA